MSTLNLSNWGKLVTKQLRERQAPVDFFDPDKIIIPQDQLRGSLHEVKDPEMGAFLKSYLLTLKELPTNNQSAFKKFCDCFSQMTKLLALDLFDGMWAAPLLDKLAELLSQLAVLADTEVGQAGARVAVLGEDEEA